MQARRFDVHGRVQGVGFRYATQLQALRLGVQGWVRNRLDGRVEVHAEGSSGQLDELARWLQHGPPTATVSGVEARDCDGEQCEGFRERPTA